jgi:membrane protease YdiL (CAAX protease family)
MQLLIDKKLITIAEIIFIFVLPVLLLKFGIIPLSLEFPALVVFSLIVLIVARKDRFSLNQLGIRADNFKEGIIPYFIFTVLGLIFIFLFAKLMGRSALTNIFQYTHFRYLFIPISFLQELAYRGYLVPKLQTIFTNKKYIFITNVFLFTYLHIFYFNLQIVLPLIFIGGIGFTYMYLRHPNLILIGISHSILNFMAVLFNFFYQ